ncbi:hypothetical protein CXG81DRAFT_6583, partial [Caulochytrium protostelioides]
LVDGEGRDLLLRGVNLCGASKLPTNPVGSSHLSDGFWDHHEVSFAGRPFPQHEADTHFRRLQTWGLTLVRLVVPWEAIEHAGPGIYDDAFIDSLIPILEAADRHGCRVVLDPHQDVWSRYSGGSGAPGWTFDVAGMDIRAFKATHAAHVHQTADDVRDTHMIWPTNYQKLASGTMFTLFFGSETFAPQARYGGQSVQQFLQTCFIKSFAHLLRRVKHCRAVVGIEVMNEPHPGYIGLADLTRFDPYTCLHYQSVPSAFESMQLGHGRALDIDFYVRSWPFPTRRVGKRVVNPEGRCCWRSGTCLWRQHGVWGDRDGRAVLLKPDYFTRHADGRVVDFSQDFWLPFIQQFYDAMLAVDPAVLVMFEPVPQVPPPSIRPDAMPQLVYAPHWYDLNALFSKSFTTAVTHDVQRLARNPWALPFATYFGRRGVKRNYAGQIQALVDEGRARVGDRPVLVGECGLPMDINQRTAFGNGDYSRHEHALDALLWGLESSGVHYTLWNYNPGNDDEWGDHWNGENFSIYSDDYRRHGDIGLPLPAKDAVDSTSSNTDDRGSGDPLDEHEGHRWHSSHGGGRVLNAILRPAAVKLSGRPRRARFHLEHLRYELQLVDPRPGVVTEIYVPNWHFPPDRAVVTLYGPPVARALCPVCAAGGTFRLVPGRQTLYW